MRQLPKVLYPLKNLLHYLLIIFPFERSRWHVITLNNVESNDTSKAQFYGKNSLIKGSRGNPQNL